jgi:hypothetical protein
MSQSLVTAHYAAKQCPAAIVDAMIQVPLTSLRSLIAFHHKIHTPYMMCLHAVYAGKGGRVKRKRAPAAKAGPQQQHEGEHDGNDDAEPGATAGGGEGSEEVDVLAVGAADETPESWARLLAGLAEICAGIGMALQNELCEWSCGHFLCMLTQLLQLCVRMLASPAHPCVPCFAACQSLMALCFLELWFGASCFMHLVRPLKAMVTSQD